MFILPHEPFYNRTYPIKIKTIPSFPEYCTLVFCEEIVFCAELIEEKVHAVSAEKTKEIIHNTTETRDRDRAR